MQREIEALLTAYLADRDKETRAVRELLSVLAVGSAERRRMFRELTAAVGALAPSDVGHAGRFAPEATQAPHADGDLSAEICRWRAARTAA